MLDTLPRNARLKCAVEILFFFSSRRRHTSFSRDWSSDVCSSDLSQSLGVCADPAPNTLQGFVNGVQAGIGPAAIFIDDCLADQRSEERRVGKECGAQARPEQLKECMQ